jgi:predicted nucleotidyltransferase
LAVVESIDIVMSFTMRAFIEDLIDMAEELSFLKRLRVDRVSFDSMSGSLGSAILASCGEEGFSTVDPELKMATKVLFS